MSNEEEKKFTLDELPETGSSSVSPPPKKVKRPVDPRIEALNSKPIEERAEALSQRWHFDRPERNVGWMLAVGGLFVLEQLQLYQRFLQDRGRLAEQSMGFSEIFIEMLELVDFFLLHPFILVIFLPLIFKFRQTSDCYFELSFDGVHTIREVELRKGEQLTRVRIKWDEISEVRKTTINKRDVLQIYSPTGKVGELIFDLDQHKKMAIKQLAKGLLHVKHPFRVFIEKEV